jgi:hypothetical protein
MGLPLRRSNASHLSVVRKPKSSDKAVAQKRNGELLQSVAALTEERVPRSRQVGFILSLPRGLPAKEVVRLAKLQGISMNEGRVYNVRWLAAHQAPKRMSKTSFVIGLAADLSAREVVARGRACGLRLSEDQVHNIRWAARRSGRLGRVDELRPALPRPPRSRAPSELRLRRLLAELGLARARQILTEMARSVPANDAQPSVGSRRRASRSAA